MHFLIYYKHFNGSITLSGVKMVEGKDDEDAIRNLMGLVRLVRIDDVFPISELQYERYRKLETKRERWNQVVTEKPVTY